jgi:hypothetical protein
MMVIPTPPTPKATTWATARAAPITTFATTQMTLPGTYA